MIYLHHEIYLNITVCVNYIYIYSFIIPYFLYSPVNAHLTLVHQARIIIYTRGKIYKYHNYKPLHSKQHLSQRNTDRSLSHRKLEGESAYPLADHVEHLREGAGEISVRHHGF